MLTARERDGSCPFAAFADNSPFSMRSNSSMDSLFEFLARQWMLVGALMVLLLLLFRHESRKAGPAISPREMTSLVNREQARVLDLRPEKDFRQGHIAGAVNIPFASLQSRLAELKKHPERPLIVVCGVGQHSGAAVRKLRAAGIDRVLRLQGGIAEWRHQQLPLVSS